MPQEELLTAIECEEWFDGEANQAMRFGGFPEWADELSERIRSQVEDKEASTKVPVLLACSNTDTTGRACLLLPAFRYHSVSTISLQAMCRGCRQCRHILTS